MVLVSPNWAKQKTFSDRVAPLSGTGIGCCAVVAIRSGSRRYCGTVSARELKSRLFWLTETIRIYWPVKSRTDSVLYTPNLWAYLSLMVVSYRLLQYLLSNFQIMLILVSISVQERVCGVVRFNSCIIYKRLYISIPLIKNSCLKKYATYCYKIIHCYEIISQFI